MDIEAKRALLSEARKRAAAVDAAHEEARSAQLAEAMDNAERDEPLSVEDALEALR